LLADLDPNDNESSEDAKARYLTQLNGDFEPKPTAIVDSGNGIQCLLRLTDRIVLGEPSKANGKLAFSPEDQAKIKDAEDRTAAIMVRLGAKAGTQNIDRILRLPGTINLPNAKKAKAGRVPGPTKLISFNGGSYSLDAFPLPEQTTPGTPDDGGHHARQDEGEQGAHEDSGDKLERIIRDGESGAFDGDRSRAVWWVVNEMLRRGHVERSIVATLLDHANKISDHVYAQTQPRKYVERQIAKAKAQHPEYKKTKVEICTDVELWDPSPPPPMEWSIHEMIAAGSVTALWGDSGVYKSLVLWNLVIARMFGLPFAHRKVSKRCGVMVWLAEGKADYPIRCRGALKHAGLDPGQRLPLVTANNKMLPLVSKDAGQQLQGMIDNANEIFQKQFGLELGCIVIDTFSMAGLFEDAYKPNEVIAVNQMLASFAELKKIDTFYTDHFPKADKNHAAGTLHKRNSVDQILVFKNGKMILDKVRYGPDKLWNPYRAVNIDDGAGNKTYAIEFGPVQQPTRVTDIDSAVMFMTALEDAQQEFGERIRKQDLEKLFIELHVAAQQKCGVKSSNPKEMARSAFRRELRDAVKGAIVEEKGGWVSEMKHPF
jgi:hypothetical protein